MRHFSDTIKDIVFLFVKNLQDIVKKSKKPLTKIDIFDTIYVWKMGREESAVMYRYRYKRPRRMRTGSVVLLLLCTALFLVSCVTGSNALWVKGVLGLDLKDYRAESVTGELDLDGERAGELCRIAQMLTSDSLELQPFSKASQAVSLYRDQILGAMLCENYSRYVGNADDIEAVAKSYPNMNLSTLVSASDLENMILRYFGGQSVRHGDGERFVYLSRSGYYTTSVKSAESHVELTPERVEETYHTYRLYFRLQSGGESSRLYVATFVKRDDGSCYLRALDVAS